MKKMMGRVQTESVTTYSANALNDDDDDDNAVIERALCILEKRVRIECMKSSASVRKYLTLRNAKLEHEVFGVLLLDNQHYIIEHVDLFRGTIDGAAVHPREVVKVALQKNAAAVIFVHNHPSGFATPSQMDVNITHKLKAALGTVDISVLDHIVTGAGDAVSMAERGLL